MENLLTISIAVTMAAVVIQAFILIAMYLALRKTSERMEALATEVKTKVLPTAEIAHSMLIELRPKIEIAINNVSESTTLVRSQMERLDATVSDVIDRARLQVIRADELLSRTIDRVEETTDMVHKTVISPVRQLSGVLQGVTAALEFLMGARRRQRSGVSVPQDEMFI
jgi:methyl-accepting chemotaxis protein